MNYRDLRSTKERGLVQITKWLVCSKKEKQFIEHEYNRISGDLTRTCCVVKHKEKIALFGNNMIERV